MPWSRLDLRVGLVAASGADLLWPGVADLADVVEIEPQTMWRPLPGGGWQLSEPAYEWAAGLGRPVLAHGVAFPVGGCQPPHPTGVASWPGGWKPRTGASTCRSTGPRPRAMTAG